MEEIYKQFPAGFFDLIVFGEYNRGTAACDSAWREVFDLVTHVAFDQNPLTCRERANDVKKCNPFRKYGEQARVVLEALLDKFTDHGVQDMKDAKVLESPSFDQFGSKTPILRGILGGMEQYTQAVQ